MGGRAAFESIGSALDGIRVRLEEAANTGTAGSSSSGGGGPLGAIADRLRTLERAYSARNPLSASTPWSASGGGPSPSLLASVNETGAAGAGGGGRDAAAESTADVGGHGRTANVGAAGGAEADARAENDASASSAAAAPADEPFANSLMLKDDRRNNLTRNAKNASSSTLLASRRLAAGVGYAPSAACADASDADDADGFGAARAGLLVSIAEPGGSRSVATGASVGAGSIGTSLEEGPTAEEEVAEEITDDDASMKEEKDFGVQDQEEEEEEEGGGGGMMQMDPGTPIDASAALPVPPPGVSKDGTGSTSRVAPPGQAPPTVYSWGIGSTGALLHGIRTRSQRMVMIRTMMMLMFVLLLMCSFQRMLKDGWHVRIMHYNHMQILTHLNQQIRARKAI